MYLGKVVNIFFGKLLSNALNLKTGKAKRLFLEKVFKES